MALTSWKGAIIRKQDLKELKALEGEIKSKKK
jgi:hypothetical protein